MGRRLLPHLHPYHGQSKREFATTDEVLPARIAGEAQDLFGISASAHYSRTQPSVECAYLMRAME